MRQWRVPSFLVEEVLGEFVHDEVRSLERNIHQNLRGITSAKNQMLAVKTLSSGGEKPKREKNINFAKTNSLFVVA